MTTQTILIAMVAGWVLLAGLLWWLVQARVAGLRLSHEISGQRIDIIRGNMALDRAERDDIHARIDKLGSRIYDLESVPPLPGHTGCEICRKIGHKPNMTVMSVSEWGALRQAPTSARGMDAECFIFFHPACLTAAGYERVEHVGGWRKVDTGEGGK